MKSSFLLLLLCFLIFISSLFCAQAQLISPYATSQPSKPQTLTDEQVAEKKKQEKARVAQAKAQAQQDAALRAAAEKRRLTEKYDPSHPDIYLTSDMATKSFSGGGFNSDKTFQGDKSYTASNSGDLRLGRPSQLNLSSSTSTKSYSESLPKAYPVSPSYQTASSTDDHQPASFEQTGKTYPPTSSAYSQKAAYPTLSDVKDSQHTFTGREASYIHKPMETPAEKLTREDNLPNRPLTIDEVRDLLNHDIKPGTRLSNPHGLGSPTQPENRPALVNPQATPEDALPVAPAAPLEDTLP